MPNKSLAAVALAPALLLAIAVLLPGDTARASEARCPERTPCSVEGGSYHVAYPTGWDGRTPLPVVVFFHGHGSSGANVVGNRSLRAKFNGAGYVLVAPTGSAGNGRTARGWPAFRGARGRRDDLAFVRRVMDDLGRRVPLDEQRLFAAGFSSGGSMAWYLACFGDGAFRAYVSVAGGLRRPLPEQGRCPAGPMRLLHIHGFADSQVPLEGRRIRDWHQGDVFEGLAVARAGNACRSQPTQFESRGRFQCRAWFGCASGRALEFCLHSGGHGLPRGWADEALRWFSQTSGSLSRRR